MHLPHSRRSDCFNIGSYVECVDEIKKLHFIWKVPEIGIHSFSTIHDDTSKINALPWWLIRGITYIVATSLKLNHVSFL